jgi:hypothetical protein
LNQKRLGTPGVLQRNGGSTPNILAKKLEEGPLPYYETGAESEGNSRLGPLVSDQKRLWDLALLYDISHHESDLHTKLQGQQKPIFDMFRAVRDFEMKLELFLKHF